MEAIDDCVFLLEACDVALWAKAVRRDTGDDTNLVGLPVYGLMMLPNGSSGHIPIHILLPPEAAQMIANGLLELLAGDEPPPFNIPGAN